MTIRRFRWSDVEGLANIFNEIGGLSGTAKAYTPQSLGEMLSQPGCHPEQHCFVAEADGILTGYMLVTYEQPISRAVGSGGVLQDHRGNGIGRALLSSAIEHSANLGVDVLHVETSACSHDAQHILTSEGFVVVKQFWQMRWEDHPIPDVSLPSDFAVRPLIAGQDDEALTFLQNTAFGENWGFSPNTVEQIRARIHQNMGGPEGILLITECGKPAAYNWTMLAVDGANSTGRISMTGVHPNYRGRGLGRAVVAAGIAHLVHRGAAAVELEVDSDNTPARELYLKLGFQRVSKTIWYEKRFK